MTQEYVVETHNVYNLMDKKAEKDSRPSTPTQKLCMEVVKPKETSNSTDITTQTAENDNTLHQPLQQREISKDNTEVVKEQKKFKTHGVNDIKHREEQVNLMNKMQVSATLNYYVEENKSKEMFEVHKVSEEEIEKQLSIQTPQQPNTVPKINTAAKDAADENLFKDTRENTGEIESKNQPLEYVSTNDPNRVKTTSSTEQRASPPPPLPPPPPISSDPLKITPEGLVKDGQQGGAGEAAVDQILADTIRYASSHMFSLLTICV